MIIIIRDDEGRSIDFRDDEAAAFLLHINACHSLGVDAMKDIHVIRFEVRSNCGKKYYYTSIDWAD